MKLKDIVRVFKRNWALIIGFPLLLSMLVYFITRSLPRTYSSDFLVYTGIASGYKLTSEENPRVDYYLVNNAFDNMLATLKARETLEEVGIRLLAKDLTANNSDYLKQAFPEKVRKMLADTSSIEQTVKNLKALKEKNNKNRVFKLLNSETAFYGYPYLKEHLNAMRKENSDMLEISYSSSNPAVTKNTLDIVAHVFLDRYKNMQEGEINKVVDYFKAQTEKNYLRLKKAEDAVKQFGVKYKIIDYTNQAGQLTASRKSIQEDIEKDKMVLAAANAVVHKINQKLSGRQLIMENNQMIMQKRAELAEVNQKIANADVRETSGKELLYLKEQSEQLKKEIKNIVNKLYKLQNTEEGISGSNLLDQYLTNMLAADEATARLAVLEKLDKEYDQKLRSYAPLGATISALEREVKVAENEYLNSLNAFNTNKQKQQSLLLSRNLKLVDAPVFPIQADPDKRLMLVAGAFVAGLSLIAGLLLGLWFLNDNIKTPMRAEQLTGLEIAGIFPFVPAKSKKQDYDYLEKSLSEQAISAIVLQRKDIQKPTHIVVTGLRPGEGKIRSAVKIACKLAKINGKVLLLYPSTEKLEIEYFLKSCTDGLESLQTKEYAVKNDFIENARFENLSNGVNDFNYVITVVSSFSESMIPVHLLADCHLSLLVLDANRKWIDSDKYLLKLLNKYSTVKPKLILNKVAEEEIKEIVGKLPLRRKEKAAEKEKVNVKISKVS